MSGMSDKAAGIAKEVVAEIIGDGKLQEEGKRQRKEADADSDRADILKAPPENLHDLT